MFIIPPGTRGLIFDCDGTLADTMPLHLRCWQRAMRELGGDLTDAEFWDFAGIPTRAIIELINKKHGYTIDPVTGGALKERCYVELVHEVHRHPRIRAQRCATTCAAALRRKRLRRAVLHRAPWTKRSSVLDSAAPPSPSSPRSSSRGWRAVAPRRPSSAQT
jgi:beta-phosphoglucomutase-like phosphatase (HAD superfamily)